MIREALAGMLQRAGDRLALGYDAGERNRMRRDLGWDRSTPRDEDALVAGDGTRELMRLKSNDLRRNNAVVSGACDRIDTFAVGIGITPEAQTDDDKCNAEYEQFFGEWAKVCDYRQRVTLWEFQKMAVSLRPTHGGIYFQLMDNGQIAPIECERIRDPQKPEDRKGFVDGVKLAGASGVIAGYMVHDRDSNGAFTGPHRETLIPREQIIPVISQPWRADQLRELPELAPIIDVLQDINDTNKFMMNTHKWQSQNVGALKKLAGSAANSGARGSGSVVGKRQTWTTDWGQMFELFPGEDFQNLSPATPGMMHIPYMQFQLGMASQALGTPYEFFTLDFSRADFSRMKGILLFINFAMRPRRKWLNQYLNQRLWNWRIAKAIKDKDVRPAPVEDRNGLKVSQWYRVAWQAPEELWIDRQETNQSDTLEWQAGLGTLGEFASRRGKNLETTLRQKAKELEMQYRIEDEFKLPRGSLVKMQIPGQTNTNPAGPDAKSGTPNGQ